ncbi:YncE family protein [Actibacterium pelagium]|nr:hypothetical protein [Actibacterium pelagium]
MIEIIEAGAQSLSAAVDGLSSAARIELADGLSSEAVNLKRTEDCRFSPNGKVIAVAGFLTDTILLFEISQQHVAGNLVVRIEGKLTLTHPRLSRPHGIDFIDETTIAVANRDGRLIILKLPQVPFDGRTVPAKMLMRRKRIWMKHKLKTPGSVAVTRKGRFTYELLTCLNYRNTVASPRFLRLGDLHLPFGGRIALQRGMEIPDGVSICPETARVAISNHNENAIRLYSHYDDLRPNAHPVGRLLGMAYPHGLRFFDKGRRLMAADAGAPLIHYWRDDTAKWDGDRTPTASFRIMDKETFAAGRYNDQEGGPKGIDIHPSGAFLVVTSEHQGFAAFDVPKLLQRLETDKTEPAASDDLPETPAAAAAT